MMQTTNPPPPHISPKGMWTSKLILRIIQFVLAVAVMGCVGSVISTGVWTMLALVVILPQVSCLPSPCA